MWSHGKWYGTQSHTVFACTRLFIKLAADIVDTFDVPHTKSWWPRTQIEVTTNRIIIIDTLQRGHLILSSHHTIQEKRFIPFHTTPRGRQQHNENAESTHKSIPKYQRKKKKKKTVWSGSDLRAKRAEENWLSPQGTACDVITMTYLWIQYLSVVILKYYT